MKSFVLVSAFIVLALVSDTRAIAAEAPKVIVLSEVRSRQQHHKDFMLIDCRSRSDFETKHIEGAVSVPVFELGYMSLPKERDMILYCGGNGCNISAVGAKKLAERGYRRVWVMTEGLAGWEAKGYPVVKKEVEKMGYEKKQQ